MTVADGVEWIRLPLPFTLDHINVWLLDDWVIVDCGYASDDARTCWERILEHRRMERIVVTHGHPDHIGLGAWLCGKLDVRMSMTPGEFQFAHDFRTRRGALDRKAVVAFYAMHGADVNLLERVVPGDDHYARGVPSVPQSFEPLAAGGYLDTGRSRWRVMIGRGHSPEHAALYCVDAGVLISGDMLLPRITSHVTVWPMEPDGDPLGEFLRALDEMAALPADTLVLPSHGLPFRGIAQRVLQLKRHHDERLQLARDACIEPKSAADLLSHLFPSRQFNDYHLVLAMGETLAHLQRLVHGGQLERVSSGDGIVRYRRTAAERSA